MTKARTKTHKKHGTVRTDLAKRKTPTVAKHVSQEFRSRRVKPTAKERIMAKAHKEWEDEPTVLTEAPPAPEAKEEPPPAEELLAALELNYQHGAGINPRMIELAQILAGEPGPT